MLGVDAFFLTSHYDAPCAATKAWQWIWRQAGRPRSLTGQQRRSAPAAGPVRALRDGLLRLPTTGRNSDQQKPRTARPCPGMTGHGRAWRQAERAGSGVCWLGSPGVGWMSSGDGEAFLVSARIKAITSTPAAIPVRPPSGPDAPPRL